MAANGGVYAAYMEAVSVSGAITLVQVKAGSAVSIELLRAWVSQSGSTTSAMQRIRILRKSAAATVTSFTPVRLSGGATADSAGGTSATGTNASNEGTDGDVLVPDAFNVLNGWLWLPTPEERIIAAPGTILALVFPAAPGSALTVTAGMIFREFGA